jgi:two-component system cell cycle sensor histidine kinase/response regulator CckA
MTVMRNAPPSHGHIKMGTPLRLLILEDNPSDAEMVMYLLRRAGYDLVAERVETEEEFRRHLQPAPDIVIADFSLPGFDALSAIKIVQDIPQDIPFILVTGTIGEEAAVEMLRAGAGDYLIKGQLTRLASVVDREIREAENRRVLRQAESDRNGLLARLNLQIERLPLAYLLTGPDLRYTRWNPAAERMFGYSEAEALGCHPFDIIVPPQSRAQVGGFLDLLKAGEMNAHGVCENVTQDGRAVICEWYNTPLMDEDGAFLGLISLAQDITERKDLEEQLRQAQKMEAFGQLAGGVAHDFNNLLTIILGYSEMTINTLLPDDQNRGRVEAIHNAGERAALLTQQLLAFSRKQVVKPQVVDLNAVVAGTQMMLGRLIGEDVTLTTVAAPGLERVKVDPGQVGQVLMNLVMNARDAMPRGGRITIETANVDLEESYVQSHAGVKAGRYVLLAVSDDGCGMTEEVQRHIFEPFFTTKDIGMGTGLGLATVFGIVKQSGGHVWAYSEAGVGTTFKVYLPSVSEVISPVRTQADLAPVPPGSETILLVEDETAVREITGLTLKAMGYTLLEAANGEEAIRLCKQRSEPIHLLVSDVVMPGIGGRQLAERLTTLHPEMRVLFVSGYTDDAVVRHGVLQAEVAFLQKPYSMAALSHKVRAVLDGEN